MALIETNVVIARGHEDFFETFDFDFGPAIDERLFMIIDIHKWIEIYDTKVVKGNKVIFNGFLWKNIVYKTVDMTCPVGGSNVIIKGDVRHVTARKKIEGLIPVELLGHHFINPKTDVAIVLSAEVLGEVDEKLDEMPLYAVQYAPKVCVSPRTLSGQLHGCSQAPVPPAPPIPSPLAPPVYTYGKLHEKVCYRIEVKVVRDQIVEIDTPYEECE